MSEDSKLIEMMRTEMRSGFRLLADGIDQTNAQLSQTNAKLDQTNARLDQTNLELNEFKTDTASKLDGISAFLLRSEQSVGALSNRIDKVERRVERLERKNKPA